MGFQPSQPGGRRGERGFDSTAHARHRLPGRRRWRTRARPGGAGLPASGSTSGRSGKLWLLQRRGSPSAGYGADAPLCCSLVEPESGGSRAVAVPDRQATAAGRVSAGAAPSRAPQLRPHAPCGARHGYPRARVCRALPWADLRCRPRAPACASESRGCISRHLLSGGHRALAGGQAGEPPEPPCRGGGRVL